MLQLQPLSRPARSGVRCCSSAQKGETFGPSRLRRLILLRHGDHAEAPGQRDHDRPLTSVGKEQGRQTAQKLKELGGWEPDLVLASNAKRTKETLDEMCTVLASVADSDTHLYGSLYTVAALDGQTRQHLAECLLEVADDNRHAVAMCVGHNKGWEEAASSWAGAPIKLSPASAALLQAKGASWKDVLAEEEDKPVQWELYGVVGPKGFTPASTATASKA